jgi:hypothetical protein
MVIYEIYLTPMHKTYESSYVSIQHPVSLPHIQCSLSYKIVTRAKKIQDNTTDALKAALGVTDTKKKLLVDIPLRTWSVELMRNC